MDVENYDGGRLGEERINFFRAFGFLTFRQMLTTDEMETLGIEFKQAMADQYADRAYDPSSEEERVRRQWSLMMEADTPFHASLLEDPRFHGLARQLYGDDVIGIKVQCNRFGGHTPWHRDTYTVQRGGVKLLMYHQAADRTNGALRLIPLTHLIGDNYLFAEKLRRLPVEQVPCHFLDTRPGDVLAFDMRLWHGSTGGQERSESSLTYYNNPKSEEEEEALRLRAWTNLSILTQEFGGKRQYFYSRDWLENRDGSPSRARWIARLREVGYFDAPGVIEPDGGGTG